MDLLKERHAERQGSFSAGKNLETRRDVEREYRRNAPKESLLDKQVSMRTLLRNVFIVLLVVAVLVGVFFLGRYSASSSPKSSELAAVGSSANVAASLDAAPEVASADNSSAVVTVSDTSAGARSDDGSVDSSLNVSVVNSSSVVNTSAAVEASSVNVTNASSAVVEVKKDAGEGYDYRYVNAYIDDIDYEVKGDDWGTVTSLKITVENLEKVSVHPSAVKARLYVVGEEGNWWDLEEDVPALMTQLLPKQSVAQTFEAHISYSGLDSEKTLKVAVYDQYDKKMAEVVKKFTLS
jgi:hypothetical protein